MGAGDEPISCGDNHQTGESFLGSEVGFWGHSPHVLVDYFRPFRATQFSMGVAEEVNILTIVLPSTGEPAIHSVDYAEHRDNGSGVDWRSPGLVIQADISTRDRNFKLQTGIS